MCLPLINWTGENESAKVNTKVNLKQIKIKANHRICLSCWINSMVLLNFQFYCQKRKPLPKNVFAARIFFTYERASSLQYKTAHGAAPAEVGRTTRSCVERTSSSCAYIKSLHSIIIVLATTQFSWIRWLPYIHKKINLKKINSICHDAYFDKMLAKTNKNR